MNPSRLRIAVLTPFVYPIHGYGGLERHVHHFVTRMLALGAAVRLVTRPPAEGERVPWHHESRFQSTWIDVPAPRRGRIPGRVVLERSTRYPLLSKAMGEAVAGWVRQGTVDLVYAQGLTALGYGRLKSRDASLAAPLVMNPHGMEEFKTRDPLKWIAYAPFRSLTRRAARAADRLIATDHCTVDEIPRYLGVSAAKVRVIPNAIEPREGLARVDPALQRQIRHVHRLPAGSRIVLSVGRLEPNKGFARVPPLLARLREDGVRDWIWVLVGDGPEKGRIEEAVRSTGVGETTRLVGRVEDRVLHNLYAMASLFLNPTVYEGSSIVTLEAMLHGLPILADRTAGLPDKVEEGGNGHLCRPGDADEMGDWLARWLREGVPPGMGERSRRIVEERFTWDRAIRSWLDLFEELVPAALRET